MDGARNQVEWPEKRAKAAIGGRKCGAARSFTSLPRKYLRAHSSLLLRSHGFGFATPSFDGANRRP